MSYTHGSKRRQMFELLDSQQFKSLSHKHLKPNLLYMHLNPFQYSENHKTNFQASTNC